MTALDDLNRWDELIRANRKTICCRPEDEDTVREAVDLTGSPAFFDVQVSDVPPPGAVFIVKEQHP